MTHDRPEVTASAVVCEARERGREMADAAPHVVEDCRGVLQIFSDGSVVRSAAQFSFSVPVDDDCSVAWEDLTFDPTHSLHLRLYKPRRTLPDSRLPVIVHFHGGGFCIGSRTWPFFHNFCLRLASTIPAIVAAPDYRLAPEHPLPAAIDDAFAAIDWLRDWAPRFIDSIADLQRVYVSGDSAGGNIAHHLAVGLAGKDLSPVAVRGFVVLMPFFGGKERTRSEKECPEAAFLNLELSDRYWRLSLPRGETRDHPVANPFGPRSVDLGPVELGPTLVVVGGRDLLRDRGAEYARRLEGMGKRVELVEFEGEEHGFLIVKPSSTAAGALLDRVKRFVNETA